MTGDHRQTAADWHGGPSTALYAYASTGTITAGLDDEIQECLAIVEHADEAPDLDRVGEHERLRALLHHVEPQLGATRASELGREHGRSAAAWWQQDALGGRATGDTAATARRVLQGIEDGDPAVLDLAPGWDQVASAAEIAAESGWPEPDAVDVTARARWDAAQPVICDAYAAGFAESFWDRVAEACRNELESNDRVAAASARLDRLSCPGAGAAVAGPGPGRRPSIQGYGL